MEKDNTIGVAKTAACVAAVIELTTDTIKSLNGDGLEAVDESGGDILHSDLVDIIHQATYTALNRKVGTTLTQENTDV